MEELSVFSRGQTLYFSATNIREFRSLLEKAKQQAKELENTIFQLNSFYFEFQFNVPSENAGEPAESE